MTADNDAPQTWGDIDARAQTQSDERHPFFRWSEVPDGTPVKLKVTSEPVFDKARFHSAYSIVEFNGKLQSRDGILTDYRFAISGMRLAGALAPLRPKVGDIFVLTPSGTGKAREWTATRLG